MTWETETRLIGSFNSKLLSIMSHRGYTCTALAMESGLALKTIHNILHGRTCPRVNTLLPICEVLNITLNDLYPVTLKDAL